MYSNESYHVDNSLKCAKKFCPNKAVQNRLSRYCSKHKDVELMDQCRQINRVVKTIEHEVDTATRLAAFKNEASDICKRNSSVIDDYDSIKDHFDFTGYERAKTPVSKKSRSPSDNRSVVSNQMESSSSASVTSNDSAGRQYCAPIPSTRSIAPTTPVEPFTIRYPNSNMHTTSNDIARGRNYIVPYQSNLYPPVNPSYNPSYNHNVYQDRNSNDNIVDNRYSDDDNNKDRSQFSSRRSSFCDSSDHSSVSSKSSRDSFSNDVPAGNITFSSSNNTPAPSRPSSRSSGILKSFFNIS